MHFLPYTNILLCAICCLLIIIIVLLYRGYVINNTLLFLSISTLILSITYKTLIPNNTIGGGNPILYTDTDSTISGGGQVKMHYLLSDYIGNGNSHNGNSHKGNSQHRIDTHIAELMDPYAYHTFINKPFYNKVTEKTNSVKSILAVSHIQPDAKQADYFNRTLNEDSPTYPYDRRTYEWKRCLHWGQIKLLLSEIEFCTIALQSYLTNHIDKPLYLIYAGAAPCHHAPYLSKLFPEIHFELYDPNPFSEHIGNHPMIKTYQQFFLDKDAEYWFSKSGEYHIVFVSDIRSEPPSDENIARDMKMQLGWYNIIQPELAMFKFRPSYEDGKTEFLEGKIYTQCYPGTTSTETRLIVAKGAKTKIYDNKTYNDTLSYHNKIARTYFYPFCFGTVTLKNDGIDNCYDCVRFANIIMDYLYIRMGKYTNKILETRREMHKLIDEIQKNSGANNKGLYSRTESEQDRALEGLCKRLITKCNNQKCKICQFTRVHSWDPKVNNATTENLYNAMRSRK